jgi:hypothetical protein
VFGYRPDCHNHLSSLVLNSRSRNPHNAPSKARSSRLANRRTKCCESALGGTQPARNCDRSFGLVMVACIGGIDLADYGKFDGPGRREAPAGCDNAATSSTTALANWVRCIATQGRHPPRILYAAGFVGLRHQANWYASLSYRRRER